MVTASIAFWLSAMASSAVAEEVDGTLILHRGEQAVEVYTNFAATELTPFFNGDTAVVTDEDGRVDFSNFLVDTAFMGDALFADVSAQVAGQPAQFYAMSFMLHPETLPVAFSTPWEAMSSITFCSVAPSTSDRFELPDLRSYLGLTAYPVDGFGEVILQFPETGRAPLAFEVREYVEGEFYQRYTVTIGDGGVFTAPPVDAGPVSQAAVSFGSWLFYLGVFAVIAVASGRPVDPEPQRHFDV